MYLSHSLSVSLPENVGEVYSPNKKVAELSFGALSLHYIPAYHKVCAAVCISKMTKNPIPETVFQSGKNFTHVIPDAKDCLLFL